MKSEPLKREARKAFKASAVGKLQDLLEEQTRWRRKLTIAENKLNWVRRRIDEMAEELAHEKDKRPAT